MTTDTDSLREALERIAEWNCITDDIDAPVLVARQALATLSKPEPGVPGWFKAALRASSESGNDLIVTQSEAQAVLAAIASPVPSGGAETLAAKQAREVMNPGFGSVTAPSSGQSYGMLSGCMDFTEPSPSEAISPPDARAVVEEIKTWEQRCEEHPHHAIYNVTDEMIQARMQEEIDDLRAALQSKGASI